MFGRRKFGDAAQSHEDEPLTLQEHLAELRARLIKVAAAVAFGMLGGLLLSSGIQRYFLAIIGRVAPQAEVQATSPQEKVTVYFTIAFYVAVALAMPVILYHLLRFLAPGLTVSERRLVYTLLPGAIVCFAGGVGFAVLVALPQMFRFMLNFGPAEIVTRPRAAEVLSFCADLALWTGLAFELPVVMFLLASLNVLPHRLQAQGRKYAAVGLMIVAAVITPSPDASSMLIVWAPLYLLFEVGLALARFARPRGQDSTLVLLVAALVPLLRGAGRARVRRAVA